MLSGATAANAQDAGFILAGLAAAIEEQDLSMPSLGGPSGVVSVPNAITMPADQWQATLSYQGMRASSAGRNQAPDDLGVWSLQAAHKLNNTAELWGGYSFAAGHAGSHTWALGGKKMLTHPPTEGEPYEGGPHVAVGASYHRWGDAFAGGPWEDGAARPDANVTKAYAVVTGSLTREGWNSVLLGTGGIMYLGLNPDSGRNQSLTRPFVALQVIFFGPELCLEYRWKDASLDEKPVFSAALRQWLLSDATVELGTTNASPVDTGLAAQRLFLRVNYCF